MRHESDPPSTVHAERTVTLPGGQGEITRVLLDDEPEQALPLAFINRFLPPGYSLEGDVTAGAGVTATAFTSVFAPSR